MCDVVTGKQQANGSRFRPQTIETPEETRSMVLETTTPPAVKKLSGANDTRTETRRRVATSLDRESQTQASDERREATKLQAHMVRAHKATVRFNAVVDGNIMVTSLQHIGVEEALEHWTST